jgi:hypothetical protein
MAAAVSPGVEELEQLAGEFEPVGIEELDERAALLRRVDVKYLVEWSAFVELCRRLRNDHELLDIEGRRVFRYESVYFDTADLRCYHEHEDGRIPRFKARTRLYADSERCVFEVKFKVGGGETDKRQIDYRPEDRERITPEADRFLGDSLDDCEIERPDALEPSLRTAFHRLTMAAKDAPDRLTCDAGLELMRGSESARLQPSLVVLESKSEHGRSRTDRVLEELGAEPLSLSKYRVGIEMLARPRGESLDVDRYFSTEPG